MSDVPLYNFQKEGIEFLRLHPQGILAHEPGCGKTRMALESVRDEKRVLILCPSSIKENWKNEIGKWLGSAAYSHSYLVSGTKEMRAYQWNQIYGRHWSDDHERFVVMNYEQLLKDWQYMPKEWDVIIADEATRLANHKTKTWKILFSNFISPRFIALTGTPIINSPIDLFGILNIISKGKVFPNYWKFLNRYCIREARFHRIVGFQNLKELKDIAAPYILRRLKSEVLTELPPRVIQDITFPLSEKESKQYEAIRKEIAGELQGEIGKNINLAVVKMLRLRQCVDDCRLIGKPEIESSKLAALKDILEPIIASGEKAIVFSQFSQMVDLLYHDLFYGDKEHNCYRLSGDTPTEVRQKIIDEFNKDLQGAVLVMTDAGAFGLNVTGASYVIMYDLPFSVAKYEQRVGRAHRIGQKASAVTVYNLLADVPVEKRTRAILDRKYKLSAALTGDADRLEDAGMTEDDIKSILNL